MNYPYTSTHRKKVSRVRFALATAAVALCAGLMATAAHAGESASAYQYTLHESSPPAELLTQNPAKFDYVSTHHVLQGPELSVSWWEDRTPADERTAYNAGYARYHEIMGVLVPDRTQVLSASDEQGWRRGFGEGRPYVYDVFETELKRGNKDREIAGHAAEHYVFHIRHVSGYKDSKRRRHYDVVLNLWVLPDLPYTAQTTKWIADYDRSRAALDEAFRDKGLVARMERRKTRFVAAADGSETESKTFGEVVWITDIQSTSELPPRLPIVSRDELPSLRKAKHELGKAMHDAPKATCSTTLAGDVPAALQAYYAKGYLPPAQQKAYTVYFREGARKKCPEILEQ